MTLNNAAGPAILQFCGNLKRHSQANICSPECTDSLGGGKHNTNILFLLGQSVNDWSAGILPASRASLAELDAASGVCKLEVCSPVGGKGKWSTWTTRKI